jgi:2-haloacid dehalogenase
MVSPAPHASVSVDAVVFDVFGTLVDWRGSLVEDLRAFAERHGIDADWDAFVEAWRDEYRPSLDRVRRGELPWTPLDPLHRASFDALVERFGIADALDEHARAWCVDRWHHLRPWPDVAGGLHRLRTRYIAGTLSNGNVRLLVDIAKNGDLQFDLILSAELFRHYKRDPEVYTGAVTLLATAPERVMLCAAHADDLEAAAGQGLRTAYVPRDEHGPGTKKRAPENAFDLVVSDLGDLAERLGC